MFFASSVSNSLGLSPAAFDSERSLLSRIRAENNEALIMHFGTCSVRDPEGLDTAYIVRKRLRKNSMGGYPGLSLALRRPLAVGTRHRGRTLSEFLHGRIVKGEPF